MQWMLFVRCDSVLLLKRRFFGVGRVGYTFKVHLKNGEFECRRFPLDSDKYSVSWFFLFLHLMLWPGLTWFKHVRCIPLFREGCRNLKRLNCGNSSMSGICQQPFLRKWRLARIAGGKRGSWYLISMHHYLQPLAFEEELFEMFKHTNHWSYFLLIILIIDHPYILTMNFRT